MVLKPIRKLSPELIIEEWKNILKQVSPVAWQHLNLYGRYEFRKGPETINISEIVQELAQVPVRHVLTG